MKQSLATARSPRVILVPSPATVIDKAWSELKRKRKAIWHNQARNRLIAKIAKGCLNTTALTNKV